MTFRDDGPFNRMYLHEEVATAMRSMDFESRMHRIAQPGNPPELEPVEIRRFEVRKYWPLRGWWRGHVGRLLGSYLALHEKDQPQLRDCEVGTIFGPTPGSRYGLWAVRSLAAEREKARAIVLHSGDVTIYEGRRLVGMVDLQNLERLADLMIQTRDLELPCPCVVRKVFVAFDCNVEARAEASHRGIEIITSYRPPASATLHVPKFGSSGPVRKRLI
jgi:hypothetical protein